MARVKYHFNPQTLSYERIKVSFAQKLKKVLLHLFTSFFMGLIFFVVFALLFESPYQKSLRKENDRILAQYEMLDQKIEDVQEVLSDLQQRDNNLYRVVFEAEPIPYIVRKGEFDNLNKYAYLDNLTSAEVVKSTTKRVTELRRQIYIQSKSFDEIVKLAENKELRLRCIPAIQPVYNKNLKRMASGYGKRIDPVYHTLKFHAGMDFSAPIGTPIFATGDGTISFSGWKQGYGNCVVINHGYSYETLYAHMSKFNAHRGQRVSRGDIIGAVGNTGKSTGPHLHYEVRYKGNPVNPQNYYYNDLSPEDYDKMLQITANSAQVFD